MPTSGSPSPDSALLRVQGLEVRYGAVVALQDVSLSLPAGVHALVGRNGAGKTSLLEALHGILRPRRGSLHFDGRDITRLSTYQRCRFGMAYVPQDGALFDSLSLRENLLLGAEGNDMDEVLASFPILAGRLDSATATLSGGERRSAALARAVLAAPRILLVDEPFLGLAPRIVAEVAGHLGRLATGDRVVLVADQNARVLREVCDRMIVLSRARVLEEGPAAAFSDSRLKELLP